MTIQTPTRQKRGGRKVAFHRLHTVDKKDIVEDEGREDSVDIGSMAVVSGSVAGWWRYAPTPIMVHRWAAQKRA